MCQLRFCRLSHSLSQRDNLPVVGHQFLVALYILVLLNLFQVIIEEEHLPTALRHITLQLQFCLVVLAGIEGTDSPCHPCTDEAIQAPFVAHHVFEHIQPRITIEALCKHTHLRHQCCVECLLLSIQHTDLCIQHLQFWSLVSCRQISAIRLHLWLLYVVDLDTTKSAQHAL